jgi:uncharacterized protein (DUF1810 family)
MIKNKLLYENSLERFLAAQEDCYEEVLQELRQGHKQTHWIWFIFPQLQGLGHSEYSQYYGFGSEHSAKVYWDHPVLGGRYRECLDILLASHHSVESILGELDAKKLQSSLTLFDYAVPNNPLLKSALNQLFGGVKDWVTIDILVRPVSERNS